MSEEKRSNSEQITEKQHFVPKFYLKRFADSKQFLNILNVKKRELGKARPYPSVCYSSFFYGAKTGVADEASQRIEQWLKQNEDCIANQLDGIINRILSAQQITNADKYILSALFSLLWTRGIKMRNQVNMLQEDLAKKIMSSNAENAVESYLRNKGLQWNDEEKEGIVKLFKDGDYNIEFGNAQHLIFMVECLGFGTEGFTNMFFGQHWNIYLARGKRRFITSDNPVVEWSLPPKGIFGRSFLDHNHYLALGPEILLELKYPSAYRKAKRTTLFEDKDEVVMMYNHLFAAHSHEFAYSSDRNVFPDMLKGISEPGRAELLYHDQFERPWRKLEKLD